MQITEYICTKQLDLLLEPGTTIQEKHRDLSSIPDLALCTPELISRIASCKIADFTRSDYKPIETTIQIDSPVCTNLLPKRNFRKTNTEAVIAGAKWLQVPQEVASTQTID